MNRLLVHSAITLALSTAALAVQAGPVTLNHHGFTTAGSVNVKVGQTNDPNKATVTASAGAFSVSLGTNQPAFVTYCVELTQNAVFASGLQYTLMDGLDYFSTNFAPALAAPAATVMDRLGRLFTSTGGMHLPTGGTLGTWSYNAAQASAAMQLAVWETVYEAAATGEDSFFGLSLSSPGFQEMTTGTLHTNIRNLANSFLASAAAVNEALFQVQVLRHDGHQDYLVVTEMPTRNDVPLPGTLALVSLGLIGMAAVRRRRAG